MMSNIIYSELVQPLITIFQKLGYFLMGFVKSFRRFLGPLKIFTMPTTLHNSSHWLPLFLHTNL